MPEVFSSLSYLTMVPLLSLAMQNEPSFRSIEDAALAQRKALVTGHVTFEATGTSQFGNQARLPPQYTQNYSIWFDEGKNRIRIDAEQSPAVLPSTAQRSIIQHCLNCEEQGRYVHFFLPDATSTTEVLNYKPMEEKTHLNLDFRFDPRLIGWGTEVAQGLKYYDFNTYFLAPTRTELRVASDNYRGESCWRLEFILRKRLVKIWVVPAWDHSVGKISVAVRENDRDMLFTVESEMRQWGKVWFPKRTVYERRDDNVVTESETVEVTSAVFNQPLAADVFRLSGMNVRDGQVINIPDRKPVFWTWKDGRLIPRTNAAPPVELDPEPVKPAGNATTWYGITGAAGVALVAFGVFWWCRPRTGLQT